LTHQVDVANAEWARLQTEMESRQSEWDQTAANLAARATELDARQLRIDEQERVLESEKESLAQTSQEIVAALKKRQTLEREIHTQLTLLDELRERGTRLRGRDDGLCQEIKAAEAKLAESRGVWETKEADLAMRYEQLERRFQALESNEEAVKRRVTELDETECRLEQELDRQQRQAIQDQREIERLRSVLRQNGLDPSGSAPKSCRAHRESLQVE
jgi:chromosome segregation ATPase